MNDRELHRLTGPFIGLTVLLVELPLAELPRWTRVNLVAGIFKVKLRFIGKPASRHSEEVATGAGGATVGVTGVSVGIATVGGMGAWLVDRAGITA